MPGETPQPTVPASPPSEPDIISNITANDSAKIAVSNKPKADKNGKIKIKLKVGLSGKKIETTMPGDTEFAVTEPLAPAAPAEPTTHEETTEVKNIAASPERTPSTGAKSSVGKTGQISPTNQTKPKERLLEQHRDDDAAPTDSKETPTEETILPDEEKSANSDEQPTAFNKNQPTDAPAEPTLGTNESAKANERTGANTTPSTTGGTKPERETDAETPSNITPPSAGSEVQTNAGTPKTATPAEQERANALSSDRARARSGAAENQSRSPVTEDTPLVDDTTTTPPQLQDNQTTDAAGDMEAGRQNELARRGNRTGPDLTKMLAEKGIDTKNFITDLGKKFLGGGKKSTNEQIKSAWMSELKERMNSGKITAFSFILSLALIKDAPDIAALVGGDPGVIGDIINLFVTPILISMMSCQGNWLKQKLFNKFFGWIVAAIIAELIPGASAFPSYTAGALALFFSSRTDLKNLGVAINILNKQNAKNGQSI